jgi:MFS family permease
MVDVLATTPQVRSAEKTDQSLRTLAAISTAHWVSHFHMFVPPMLFPFLKEQLGVGYVELGFALTVFAVTSGLTQAPIGYLADHIGARKVLLMGLTVGGFALIMPGLHLSYPWLIASAVLLGLANSVYHPANYAILSAHMNEARMGRAFSIHTFAGFLGGAGGDDRRSWCPDCSRCSGTACRAAAAFGRHSRCECRGPPECGHGGT